MSKIQVKMLHNCEDLPVPAYAYSGDAGFDLRACEEVTVEPGEQATVRTGIALELPEGYSGFIWDKAGIAQKFGVTTLAGVINGQSRDEITVTVANLSKDSYTFDRGDKVAQVVIQETIHAQIEVVDELSNSDRS